MKQLDYEILRLAVPAIVSNVAVPLLGMIDLLIVGHLGDASFIGAIAIGSMIFNVIYWLFGFLRMGTSGMTSQAFGRNDDRQVVGALLRAVAFGGLLALTLLVLQYPLGRLALWAMQTPEESVPLVSTYYYIVIWGAPAMLGQYGLTGWLIGMQTRRRRCAWR